MVVAVGGGAVPGGTVAAGGVALAAGAVVPQGDFLRGVCRRLEARVACFVLALAAGGGGDTALALSVVEGAEDDGAVDVAAHEVDENFLPDARQPLPAHPRSGLSVEDADPAAITVLRGFGQLPVEAYLDAPQSVAPEFVGAVGGGLAVGADDEGAHRAGGGGSGVETRSGAVVEFGTPGRESVLGTSGERVDAEHKSGR